MARHLQFRIGRVPQHLMTQCMTFIELIAESPGHQMGKTYSGQQAAGIDMLTSVPTKTNPAAKSGVYLGLEWILLHSKT